VTTLPQRPRHRAHVAGMPAPSSQGQSAVLRRGPSVPPLQAEAKRPDRSKRCSAPSRAPDCKAARWQAAELLSGGAAARARSCKSTASASPSLRSGRSRSATKAKVGCQARAHGCQPPPHMARHLTYRLGSPKTSWGEGDHLESFMRGVYGASSTARYAVHFFSLRYLLGVGLLFCFGFIYVSPGFGLSSLVWGEQSAKNT